MQHTYQAEGFGVRLRPVRMEDAPFIIWLRNSDHAQGNIGDSASDVAGQEAWLRTYFKREGDCYFIVETPAGIPAGTYGIYHIQRGEAEPGRWVARPGVPVAIPSVLLALDLAFHQMKLIRLNGTTVATNEKVLSLNRKLGFRRVRVESAAQIIGGKAVDLVHYTMILADWLPAREQLLPLVRLAETQIRTWEKTQTAECQPWLKR